VKCTRTKAKRQHNFGGESITETKFGDMTMERAATRRRSANNWVIKWFTGDVFLLHLGSLGAFNFAKIEARLLVVGHINYTPIKRPPRQRLTIGIIELITRRFMSESAPLKLK